MHTKYVDNFVAMSQDVERSKLAAVELQGAMTRAGLRTHPVESSVGGETLGWSFGSDAPVLGVNARVH
eukprot:2071611-Amphidinium_carterae.1